MKGIPMTGPSLVVGDTLVLDDRELVITKLVPATAADAIRAGAREVFSLGWSITLEGRDTVNVFPRHGAFVEQAGVAS
ncbi:hypothetical protein E1286_04915 [Nonomuraea terrae]|uniref:Uncharacterized protein n=1 Tax=Nonomuraea terrae TaxID=2530383 RepID=A0A4R4ZAZ9_9ACTN|nr:hypothetical protein [Nonomuraea terrae]TDD54534.1 hypothetical protein E1286_04915 [Nonomuraea terrae]